MAALVARRDGARVRAGVGRVKRPCEPDDVVKCLDTLYRRRRIDLVHARILRIWGERQAAPSPGFASERGDWRLWREARGARREARGARRWSGWSGCSASRASSRDLRFAAYMAGV
jgi:hypothetical protein